MKTEPTPQDAEPTPQATEAEALRALGDEADELARLAHILSVESERTPPRWPFGPLPR
jgi:hypothetical protein